MSAKTDRERHIAWKVRHQGLASTIPSKVRRFLKDHPDQAPAIEAFMTKLAKSVRKPNAPSQPAPSKSTWESEHPNGRAAEFNEDSEE